MSAELEAVEGEIAAEALDGNVSIGTAGARLILAARQERDKARHNEALEREMRLTTHRHAKALTAERDAARQERDEQERKRWATLAEREAQGRACAELRSARKQALDERDAALARVRELEGAIQHLENRWEVRVSKDGPVEAVFQRGKRAGRDEAAEELLAEREKFQGIIREGGEEVCRLRDRIAALEAELTKVRAVFEDADWTFYECGACRQNMAIVEQLRAALG